MKLFRIGGKGGHITYRYTKKNGECKRIKYILPVFKYTIKSVSYVRKHGLICEQCYEQVSPDYDTYYFCTDGDKKIHLTCAKCTPDHLKEELKK